MGGERGFSVSPKINPVPAHPVMPRTKIQAQAFAKIPEIRAMIRVD